MELKNINTQNDEKMKTLGIFSNSRMQSIGGCATFILLAVNVTLILGSAWILINTQLFARNTTDEICLSEQCINTASEVLRAMDRSVDPCVDFYQYACGSWMREHPLPEWTASWDRLAVLRESLLREMRQLLEAQDKDIEPAAVKKARKLYRTCMNTDDLERKGLQPIRRTLREVGLSTRPPGWRTGAADNKDEGRLNATAGGGRSFDWLFTIAQSRRLLGINILYGFNVAEDVRNSSLFKIVIEQISPGFGEKFLLQPTKFPHELLSYKNHINKMLTTYLKSNTSNNINQTELSDFTQKFADDVVDFATQIAQLMTPGVERRSTNHLFHEVTLNELEQGPPGHEQWQTVNWTKYLDIVFSNTSVILSVEEDRAILLDLFYMQRVATYLSQVDEAQMERFLWWTVFSALAPLTIEEFRSLGYEFSRQLVGLKARSPRWKGCANNVNANFGLALSYAYVHAYLTHHEKEGVLSMLEGVRGAFEEAVHDLDWMDAVTREKTLSKLHAIRAFVGYPGWIMNATQLDKYYKQAYVDDDLFNTFLNLTNAGIARSLKNLRRKPNRNRWVATATTVNAFYSATLNSVTFPAGILRPPFYGNGIAAIDYGGIGAIMGHEVTHGFDDQGRRYDEHGNLKQWWSLDTLQHYHDKVRCIIEQYNNYSMPELGTAFTVQGINTQGENIADNGGLRAAYVAYRRLHQRGASTTTAATQSQAQRLPGLSHVTDDQLFFLGFAQIWCGNATPGALKSKLVDGVHAPNRVRVLGTLANAKEFAAAWRCPAGAPMNPHRKCVLW